MSPAKTQLCVGCGARAEASCGGLPACRSCTRKAIERLRDPRRSEESAREALLAIRSPEWVDMVEWLRPA